MYVVALGVLIGLFFFTIRGCFKGFGGEMGGLVGLAAFGGLIWFGYDPVCRSIAFLPQVSDNAARFYAVLGVFIVGAILFFVVAKIVKAIGEAIIPQPFNAILGGVVGAGKALFFISVIAGSVQLIQQRFNEILPEDVANPAIDTIVESWQELILPDFQRIINGEEATEEDSDTNENEAAE